MWSFRSKMKILAICFSFSEHCHSAKLLNDQEILSYPIQQSVRITECIRVIFSIFVYILCTILIHFFNFAEGENGRRDFVETVKTIIIPPSAGAMDQTVFLEFINDDINEAPEGFFAVLEFNISAEHDQRDLDDGIILIRQGVVLIVIQDDDGECYIE